MGDYLWVYSNEPLVDSEISYIDGGARVNVWYKNNFWVIMGDSKKDMNWWEVVVNGEVHVTRAGYNIVTIDLSANNK